MGFVLANWVTRGTAADGAGAIGTNRVICGMDMAGCTVDIVGIVCCPPEELGMFRKVG